MNRIAPYERSTSTASSGPIEIAPLRQSAWQRRSPASASGPGIFLRCQRARRPRHAASSQGLDIWIVDALRREPHPSHFSVAETLGWIEGSSRKRAILTHMDYSLDYAALKRELPPNVEPAYDGMVVAF